MDSHFRIAEGISKIEESTRLGEISVDWMKWNKLECVSYQLTETLHKNRDLVWETGWLGKKRVDWFM